MVGQVNVFPDQGDISLETQGTQLERNRHPGMS